MSDHAAEAKRLQAKARKWRAWVADPDAAGLDIRRRWASEADTFMAEAQVHASLAAAEAVRPTPTDPKE